MLPDGKSAVNNWCNSPENHLIPFTASRCKMLREAVCRSDARRWVQHAKQSPDLHRARGPTCNLWPTQICDSRHSSSTQRRISGYSSVHPFILHLFRGMFSCVDVLFGLFAQPGCWNLTLVCLPSCNLSVLVPWPHIVWRLGGKKAPRKGVCHTSTRLWAKNCFLHFHAVF